jgi:peptidyl-dipeptidase Dcp
MMPWDWSYYSEKLRDEKFNINDELLKPYFELEKVKKGVFGLATRLYGLQFKRNEKIPVYHKEVEAYEVFDENGKYLAVLYTDFHPRKGKSNGAWMTDYRGQKKVGGTDFRPHISVVMNFTRPTATKPALLTYDEVNTFLHEFGHALHGMLSDATYESLSGTNVYEDFVELPSQIMENWTSEPAFLDSFAVHYETGEKLSIEYIKRIKTADNFNVAYACLRQLSFGYLDMAWHTLTAPYEGDVLAFETQATASTQILPRIDNTGIAASFNHIFSGGYAAGYYRYKWAEVLDADAFSVFQKNGVFDRATAKSFRENILSKGSTEPPMVLYKRFRGQEPAIDGLLERNNIIR